MSTKLDRMADTPIHELRDQIMDLTEQRDALLAALSDCSDGLCWIANMSPHQGDVWLVAWNHARIAGAAIAAAKGEE
jgi:hypothetical protein